jgi:hypothetical protein
MEKKQVSPIVIIAAIVVMVGGLGYFGWRATLPPQPAAGSYTPGVPPWLDKNSPSYGKSPNEVAKH